MLSNTTRHHHWPRPNSSPLSSSRRFFCSIKQDTDSRKCPSLEILIRNLTLAKCRNPYAWDTNGRNIRTLGSGNCQDPPASGQRNQEGQENEQFILSKHKLSACAVTTSRPPWPANRRESLWCGMFSVKTGEAPGTLGPVDLSTSPTITHNSFRILISLKICTDLQFFLILGIRVFKDPGSSTCVRESRALLADACRCLLGWLMAWSWLSGMKCQQFLVYPDREYCKF